MPFRHDVRSSPVPGCVDGWLALHERYGRLPLERLLAPAIELAEEGFPASPLLARIVALLEGAVDVVRLLGVESPLPGSRCHRPGVAKALRAVASSGREGFYEGDFGAALLATGAGEYSSGDLSSPCAAWVTPLRARVWGHDIWTTPPNSQGYLTLAGALVAEQLDLPDDDEDPMWAHLLIEVAFQVAHDRPAVLHEHADGAALLDAERLAERRRAISVARHTPVQSVFGADGDTMFLAVADRDDMAVALIQSNAADFGAHVEVGQTGILLHNRGVGFSLEPGHPAGYGPGRRPPSTLSPALVTHPDGSLAAVIGTMGGDSQPHILLQLLCRFLRHDQPPGVVIGSPRWVITAPVHQGFDTWDRPGDAVIRLEHAAPEPWPTTLAALGHRVEVVAPGHGNFGHAHLVAVTAEGLAGAADPRALIGCASGR